MKQTSTSAAPRLTSSLAGWIGIAADPAVVDHLRRRALHDGLVLIEVTKVRDAEFRRRIEAEGRRQIEERP